MALGRACAGWVRGEGWPGVRAHTVLEVLLLAAASSGCDDSVSTRQLLARARVLELVGPRRREERAHTRGRRVVLEEVPRRSGRRPAVAWQPASGACGCSQRDGRLRWHGRMADAPYAWRRLKGCEERRWRTHDPRAARRVRPPTSAGTRRSARGAL